MAQWIAHHTSNVNVAGSSPAGRISLRRLMDRPPGYELGSERSSRSGDSEKEVSIFESRT